MPHRHPAWQTFAAGAFPHSWFSSDLAPRQVCLHVRCVACVLCSTITSFRKMQTGAYCWPVIVAPASSMADLVCSGFPEPLSCLRSQRDTVGALLPRTQYQRMLPWLLHCLSLLPGQSNSSNIGSMGPACVQILSVTNVKRT